jgi:DNA-binding SARP family transcriptional activator
MEIRLLGPVQGWRNGARIDLGPRQQRHVLAALALEVNKVVNVDRLVDLVWFGAPPRTAWQAVRVYVCRLRRALGEDAPLVTEGDGYVLLADPLRVDAHRFRALVRQARASIDDAGKVRPYRRALALWHGPALADLTSAGAQRLVCGLHEHRLAATEECLDAELRLGRHLAVLGELTDLVAQHPNQQRFVGQLMIALYRCGRHPDSLEVYRAAKSMLATEYGLDPEPRLRELELAVLRTDPGLDGPARPRAAAGGQVQRLEEAAAGR